MNRYLALLRGINVGGNNIIPMADLRSCIEQMGFTNVSTYIQTGNVFFSSANNDLAAVEEQLRNALHKSFGSDIGVVVFTQKDWQSILNSAPKSWGKNPDWKHNLLIMLRPYNMHDAIKAIGQLKPGIETIDAGQGVFYQSMSKALFGRTTTGKLAHKPIYKQMTVRNFNTAHKLLALFEAIN